MDKSIRIARRKSLSRRRSARARELDRAEAVPDRRAIDAAVTDSFAAWLHARFGGRREEIARSADACTILETAARALHADGYDMSSDLTKARWRARLRLGGAKKAARQPI